MDGTYGRTLDPEWTDRAPEQERRGRRDAIDATLALRAAVDMAIDAVAGVAAYMDSEAQPVEQRWTVRTIGHLRNLPGAILRVHGDDIVPSALRMIWAGVPKALREHAQHVFQRMEEVKTVILAGVQPRTSAKSELQEIHGGLERVVDAIKSRDARDGGDASPRKSPKKSPKLTDHDKQAWQLATLHGMTQVKVAAALNVEHGTTYTQGQVSRMIARAKAQADASGLTEHIVKPIDRPRTVDPGRLELGARVDKRTLRPSDMSRVNDDDE